MKFLRPNKRVLLLWLASIVIWGLGLFFSSLPIFPCQTFVYDSTQGFYPDICPLVIDGQLITEADGAYEDSRVTPWTWPVLALVLLVFPYLDSVFIDQKITTIQQRRKQ